MTRAEVERIRGVEAGPVLRGLIDRGLVRIRGNALRKVEKIEIDDSLLRSGKKDELEALLLEAINQLLERAREKEETELRKAAGGLIPPGLGI